MKRSGRQGFSLLEVLLAAGILFGSVIVLMELASIGNRHAASARDLSRSQLICQTKLNEIVSGLAPAELVRPTPLEDDQRWVYWVDVLPAEQPGLLVLEVSAAYEPVGRKQTARFTLVRWIRDPRSKDRGSSPSSSPPDATPGGIVRGGPLP